MRHHDPTDALAALLAEGIGFEDLDRFAADRGLTSAEIAILRDRLGLASLRNGSTTYVHTTERWTDIEREIANRLAAYHALHPDLPGMAGETLRLALDAIPTRPLFEAIHARLFADGSIAQQGHLLRLPTHSAVLRDEDRLLAELLRPLLAQDRFRPPRVRDLGRELARPEDHVRRTCKALARAGEVTEAVHDHFFLHGAVAEMARIADDLSQANASGLFAATDFRDRLGIGRKLAIQILDFFDHQGFTRRRDDLRRVVKPPELLFGRPDVG